MARRLETFLSESHGRRFTVNQLTKWMIDNGMWNVETTGVANFLKMMASDFGLVMAQPGRRDGKHPNVWVETKTSNKGGA